MNTDTKNAQLASSFLGLNAIMKELREKCPWDRKQTIHTLRSMTVEETYELTDAIMEDNWQGIREELGDLVLHIVFYATIAEEQGQFTLDDVLRGISDKLVKRHPHIYGDVKVQNEEDVKRNWEKIKLAEGKKSVLEGVPVSLPAVVKAIRIQEKARQTGFEWKNPEDVWEKVKEEMAELQEAVALQSPEKMEDEMGDVLFSLVNYARFLQVDAETALERTNRKFMTRFRKMEEMAAAIGRPLTDMSLEEMDAIWNEVKKMQTP